MINQFLKAILMGFKFTRFLLGIVILFCVENLSSQVQSIKLQVKYDTTNCNYAAWLHIVDGSASSPVHRTQFNSSVTFVVLGTDSLVLVNDFYPKTAVGDIPMDWIIGEISLLPEAQPSSNFYSIKPTLSPVARYDVLNTGDSIKMFDFIVFDKITGDQKSPVKCGEAVRMWRNWLLASGGTEPNPDPRSDAPGMDGGDFNNGFTIGNLNQLYIGSKAEQKPPLPATNVEIVCSGGINIQLDATTSTCQKPLLYEWAGPSGFNSTTEDVVVFPSTAVNNGTYQLTITDALGCSKEINVDVTGRADAGPDQSLCGPTSTSLNGVGPGGSTWVAIATNNPGATISNTNVANPTITFTPGALGDYAFAYGTTICKDTVIIERKSQPNITFSGDNKFCPGGSTVITAEGGAYYVWQHSGETTPTVTISGAGTYKVTVSDSPTCTAVGSILVSTHIPPTAVINGTLKFCEGKSTSLTASGGDSYEWSSGQNIATINVTTGDSYVVTVTDLNGCKDTEFKIVTENILPLAEINGNLDFCAGSNTILTAAGGTSFIWSPPSNATTQSITVSAAGTVTVTVTDANGCTDTETQTIVRNSLPTAAINGTAKFCQDKSALLTATGGDTYQWSTGDFTPAIIVSTGTPVVVTVTDANGCTDSETKSIIIDPLPTAIISGNLAFCDGSSTLLLGQGGVTNIWSPNNETTPTIILNNSASVVLKVTDANGCTDTDAKEVTKRTNPTAVISGSLTYCEGNPTNLTGSGGPFISWSTNESTTSIDVTAGLVVLTVSDINGCTDTESKVVIENPSPTADIFGNTSFCAGGKTTLTATGGTSYAWSVVGGGTANSVDVSSPGLVTVTVTNASGCTNSKTISVSQNALPTAGILGNLSFCSGINTSLTASGGSTYQWSVGNQTAQTINVSLPGLVTVTVTDISGCTDTDSKMISENSNPTAVINGDLEFCQGDKTTLTASGANNYKWSTGPTTAAVDISLPGSVTVTVTDANGCSDSETKVIVKNSNPIATISGNLAFCQGLKTTLNASGGDTYQWTGGLSDQSIDVTLPGVIVVTVTDAKGCKDTDSKTVIQNASPAASITGDLNFCQGNKTTLTAIGGTSYLWSTPATTATIDVTIAGPISVTVTDANGCTDSDSKTITQNNNPTAVIDGDLDFCEGSKTTLTASGASTYAWSTPATTAVIDVNVAGPVTVTVTDANGCSDSETKVIAKNTNPIATISGTPAFCQGLKTTLTATGNGSYTWTGGLSTPAIDVITPGIIVLTVTDANGCTGTDSKTVIQNASPAASITGDLDFCQGNKTTLTAIGGTSYLWSTLATTATIDVTVAGPISVTVTDANGCTDTDSKTIILNSNPIAVIDGDLDFCEGLKTTLTASGATTYAWSTPATTAVIDVNVAGPVTVTVTDANGCSDSETKVIVKNTNPIASISGTPAFCQGLKTTLTATGNGTYKWTGGITTPTLDVTLPGIIVLTVTDANGCEGTDSETIVQNNSPLASIIGDDNFCEGFDVVLTGEGGESYAWSYLNSSTKSINVNTAEFITLTVTDANGCKDTATKNIIENVAPTAVISGNLDFCEGSKTTLTASGASTYAWSTPATIATIDVNVSGPVTVTVTDANGCSDSETKFIVKNANPTADITGDEKFCTGDQVTLQATGGQDYKWSVNGGATTASVTINAGGSVSVTVTDANGCTDITTKTITQNPLPTAEILGASEFCEGFDVVLSGEGGESYAWSYLNSSTKSINVNTAEFITLTVTDANGCKDTATKNIIENVAPTAVISGNLDFCEGSKTTLTASGASTYAWSTPATSAIIDINVAGPVTVTVTDANGCSDSETKVIVKNTNPIADITGDDKFCAGDQLTLEATGGQDYKWSVNGGATTASVTINAGGLVSVTITDANGCTDVATKTITQNPLPTAEILGASEFCEGFDVVLTGEGGESYVWSYLNSSTKSINVNTAALIILTVTDVNGCKDTASKNISENTAPTAVINGDESFCSGKNVTLFASGGSTYKWSTGSTASSIVVTNPGIIILTVTDANGCTGSTSKVISQFTNPTAEITGDAKFCAGDQLTLEATGGQDYKWSVNGGATTASVTINAGGLVSVTVTDANSCTDIATKTITQNPLPTAEILGDDNFCEGSQIILTGEGGELYAWSYLNSSTKSINVNTAAAIILTVTDANGCKDTATKNISENTAPTAVITGADGFCQGGNVTLTASGGASYKWSTSTTNTTATLVVNTAGLVTLTVTDAKGCSSTATKNIAQYSAPLATISGPLEYCAGSNVTLSAGGGVVYNWTGSVTTESIVVNTAGPIVVTVTDTNGCTATATKTIIENSNPTATITGAAKVCAGEKATWSATGGVNYVWTGNVTGQNFTVGTTGVYEVTVTDAKGCKDIDSKSFEITPKPNAGAAQSVLCFTNGSAVVSAQGTGVWSLGFSSGTAKIATPNNATSTVSEFSVAGIYNMIWTVDGCADTTQINVGSQCDCPIGDNQIALADKSFCKEVSNLVLTGSTPSPANGIFDWEYSFENGAFGKIATANAINFTTGTLSVGKHTYRRNYTTTSGILCSILSNAIEINVHPEPIPAITGLDKICGPSIELSVTGGNTYAWSNGGGTSNKVVATSTANYTVTVTDLKGCTASASKSVEINPIPVATISGPLEICTGATATFTAAGGLTYVWNSGQTTPSITTSIAGPYSVIITDGKGCKDTTEINLVVTANPVATIEGPTTVCQGESIILKAMDGSSYKWSNDAETQAISVNLAGSYGVTVTDASGCKAIGTKTVTLSPLPAITISGDKSVCIGQSTTFTANGGATYLWSNNAETTASITVSDAKTYTVTATDVNGCKATSEVTMIINPKPDATISGINAVCPGASTTFTAPLSDKYVWSSGQNTQTINVSEAKEYTLVVTDDNGCTNNGAITLSNHIVNQATITGPNEICLGGTATYTASAGQSYAWSSSEKTQSITKVANGIYSVIVTDANSCTSSASVTLSVTANPIATITGNANICEGESTTLSTSGGTSYLWSTGDTTHEITVSEAKNYAVTVLDASLCEAKGNITLVVNAKPIVDIIGNVSFCDGEKTTLTAQGAQSYSWSNSNITASIEVDQTSSLTVTGTNAAGCKSTKEIVVTEKPAVIAAISGQDEICQGSSAIFTATGGTSYKWENGPTTADIMVSTPGIYKVIVTNDGCTAEVQKELKVSTNPIIAIDGDNTLCEGQSTVLSVSKTGTYLWSTGSTLNNINVDKAGTIGVTVTDATGCVSKGTIDVAIASKPNATIEGPEQICLGASTIYRAKGGSSYIWDHNSATTDSIIVNQAKSYTVTVTNIEGCSAEVTKSLSITANPIATIDGKSDICVGDKTTLTAVGGVTYFWSNNATTASIEVDKAGDYKVTVTDASGCEALGNKVISLHNLPSATIIGDDKICKGESTLLTASGSANILWNNTVYSASISVNTSGINVAVVTDAFGCSSTASIEVVVNDLPIGAILGNEEICTGASTTFMAQGGTTYLWATPSTDQSITVNTNGTYTVTITDANLCSVVVSKELKIVANPEITIDGKSLICSGSTSELSVPAGAISYLWSNGATSPKITVDKAGDYGVTVVDQSNCQLIGIKKVDIALLPIVTISGDAETCENETSVFSASSAVSYAWSNQDTTQNITVTSAGNYTVTVTDINGCQNSASQDLKINTIPTVQIAGTPSFCDGGSTSLTANGGVSYAWSNALGNTADVTINAPGDYEVTVTDINGCKATSAIKVTTTAALTALISGNADICQGGKTTLTATGGSIYKWSNGESTAAITVSDATTYTVTVSDGGTCTGIATKVVSISTNPSISILGDNTICQGETTTLSVGGGSTYDWTGGAKTASIDVTTGGIYEVTMTDASGCTYKGMLNVKENPKPVAQVTGVKDFCEGTSINLNVSGGNSYKWQDGSSTNNINIDTTTNYIVTVTDVNNCSAIATGNVTEMAKPMAAITGNPSMCQNSSAELIASGGTSYIWSNNFTTDKITVNAAGIYMVTVTNAASCTSTASHVITIDNNPTVFVLGDSNICEGDKTTLSVSGNGLFLWTGGLTTSSIQVSTPGTYEVTLTDANGCVAKGTKTIVVNAKPTADVTGAKDFCEGTSVNLIAGGGISYKWHDGSSLSTFNAISTTTFTVTVTGTNGCTDTIMGTVTRNLNPIANINGDNEICSGDAAILTASGANDFQWSHGPKTAQVTITAEGTYTLTITDQNGCKDTSEKTITVNAKPIASVTGTNILCQGEKTTFVASDGASYLWNDGQTTKTITPNGAGEWTVTVVDTNGCKDDASINLSFKSKPEAGKDNEIKCFKSEVIKLDATGIGQWSVLGNPAGCKIDNTSDPKSIISFTEEGAHTLLWTVEGCSDTVKVLARGFCDCPIGNNSITSPSPNIFCSQISDLVISGSEAEPSTGLYLWLYSAGNDDFKPAPGKNDDRNYSTGTLFEGSHSFRRIFMVTEPIVCEDTTDAITIIVRPSTLPAPINPTVDPTPICLGDTIYLKVEGEPNTSFVWTVDNQNGGLNNATSSFTTMVPTQAGKYQLAVRQIAEECQVKSEPILFDVVVNSLPVINLGPDSVICELDGLVELEVGDFDNIQWTNGSTLPSISVDEKGTYGVTVTNLEGCATYDEITLKHFCCKIYHPNIINVNSATYKNREFKLSHTDCVIKSSLTIFDRWGNLVYKSEDGLAPWDGTFKGRQVEQGVYTFIFDYTALDENEQEFEDKVSGDVTVIK